MLRISIWQSQQLISSYTKLIPAAESVGLAGANEVVEATDGVTDHDHVLAHPR